MKKIILLTLISFVCISVNAQVANSKWRGTLHLESPREVIFNFKTDTLEAISPEDNSIIEMMHYSISDSVITLQKISGQSECDQNTIGKYKFEMDNDGMQLTLMEDDCDDRSGVLDDTKWVKEQ